MMAKSPSAKAAHARRKGAGFERELVNQIKEAGIHAERVVRTYDGDHDIDIYPNGKDNAPLVAEAKIRRQLPSWLITWLGDNDVLFMRQDRGNTIAVLPYSIFEYLLKQARR